MDGLRYLFRQEHQFGKLRQLIQLSDELSIQPNMKLDTQLVLAKDQQHDESIIELLRDFDWANVAEEYRYDSSGWKHAHTS